MKQKIVVKVHMSCEKCRNKAMKIAALESGVSSIQISGEGRDQLVVVGDEVDSVCLTRSLRKKFACATLLSVEEVKEETKEKEPPKIEGSNESASENQPVPPLPQFWPMTPNPQTVVCCQMVEDPNPDFCSIM